MQKRSQRLKPVLTVAEREQDVAQQRYRHQQQDHALASDKLAQLQSYCQEYIAEHQPATGCTIDPAYMHSVSQFLQRLQQVIVLQGDEVARQARLMTDAEQAWLQTRQRCHSLERLLEQYRREERELADKREQNRLDDMNGQRHVWRQQHEKLA